MKVLLLNGSPHKQGCTYTALCEVCRLGLMNSNTKVSPNNQIICNKCTGCGKSQISRTLQTIKPAFLQVLLIFIEKNV